MRTDVPIPPPPVDPPEDPSTPTTAQTHHQLCRTIGARVRAERRRLGLTQEQLAEMTGFSTNYIAHIERASRGVSLGALVVLATVLRVPAHVLLVPGPVLPPARHRGRPVKEPRST